jgi:hypothetical protein
MTAMAKNLQAIGHSARLVAISGVCYAMLAVMLVGFFSQAAMQKALQFLR